MLYTNLVTVVLGVGRPADPSVTFQIDVQTAPGPKTCSNKGGGTGPAKREISHDETQISLSARSDHSFEFGDNGAELSDYLVFDQGDSGSHRGRK
jgi:hypothetical protein